MHTSREPEQRAPLLVDWCTWPAVGHVVEGLQVAAAYAATNRYDVSLMVNSRAATELASCCPWLSQVYRVDPTVPHVPPAALVAEVPRDWAWVEQTPHRRDTGLLEAFPEWHRLATATREHYRLSLAEKPAPVAEYPLRLTLPEQDRAEAARIVGDAPLVITVMLSGSGDLNRYPSVGSWSVILQALRGQWPDAAIAVLGRAPTTGGPLLAIGSSLGGPAVAGMLAEVGAIDGYDLPLLTQLALVERSGFFLSPHTGFGFLASTVNTPWLTLSGGPWYEYFHNGAPFHSLIPDTRMYTAFLGLYGSVLHEDTDGSGERDRSMLRERIDGTLPELLDAAKSLLNRERSYEECLAGYFPELLHALHGQRDWITSWGDIHHRYI